MRRLAVTLIPSLSSKLRELSSPAERAPKGEVPSRTGLYLPTVLPDEDGWERIDDLLADWNAADVFLEDEYLVIDADRSDVALFRKREDVADLAPAYRLNMELSLVGQPSGWLRIGGYLGMVFQDRVAILFGTASGTDELAIWMSIDLSAGNNSFEFVGGVISPDDRIDRVARLDNRHGPTRRRQGRNGDGPDRGAGRLPGEGLRVLPRTRQRPAQRR